MWLEPFGSPAAAVCFAVGGADLYTELSCQDVCRAGEARICRSFNLPSTHIAYTVRMEV